MEKHDFIHLYWKNYIAIEKEFCQTLNYVSLEAENYNTFSGMYLKLLLQIGSEIDIVAKAFCNEIRPEIKAENISQYRPIIMRYSTDFCSTDVKVLQGRENLLIKPWESWSFSEKESQTPDWWRVYNKIKHDRIGSGSIGGIEKRYYKFANLKYVLYALAGLYQLLVYFYFKLAIDEPTKDPLPGSRLFNLSGNEWYNIAFHQNIAFYLDDGTLYYKTGEFAY